jgi:hypothetical protein
MDCGTSGLHACAPESFRCGVYERVIFATVGFVPGATVDLTGGTLKTMGLFTTIRIRERCLQRARTA